MHVPAFRAGVLSLIISTGLLAQSTSTGANNAPIPPTPEEMAAHQVSSLTTLLSLTDTQVTQATTFFTTEATTISAVRTSLDTANTALQSAIIANDATAIAAAANQIGTLSAQQVQAHATAEAALYAILTADQQATYQKLLVQGFLGGGRGGPSGHEPGGPGGPH